MKIPEKLKEFFKSYKGYGVVNLFRDYTNDVSVSIFNLGLEDTEDTYSFRKLYMQFLDDPTEISFVDNVLGGRFDLLERIKTNNKTKEFYNSVRAEAEQRRLANNIKQIVEIAKDTADKNRFSALKYLSDNSFVGVKSENKRGRPSKEEKEGALKLAMKEMTEDEQDLARLLQ